MRDPAVQHAYRGSSKRAGRPPKTIHPLDQHYDNLQRELRRTFETLNLAA
jgi:hypothetical protein